MMIDYNTKIIEVERPLDADLLRQAMVANARSLVGITASDPTTKPIFEKLLGPCAGQWDLKRPFRVKQVNGKWVTEGVSTCGLVGRGLWRRMNVDMDELYHNYISGTAISAEIAFAKKHNAWQPTWKGKALDLRPQPGDYCVMGEGLFTHVFTNIDWAGDEAKLVSVDGGQTDSKSLQCINRVERFWTQKGPNENSVEPFVGTKKLVGWIILDLLPFRGTTMLVPEGWETVSI